jgi:D-3-phosphoglycerate dehydrogenase/(S)-sulfolactate dehydrogenase
MTSSPPLQVVTCALKPPIEAALLRYLAGAPSVTVTAFDVNRLQRAGSLESADILVVGYAAGLTLSADLIADAPRLRAILSAGMGFDHIDTAAAASRGIPVANAPEFAVSVAEAALTLILMITKHFPAMQRAVKAGQWPAPGEDRGHTLAGKTLGIVGLGRIGSILAGFARGLSMHVITTDPNLTSEQALARGAEALVSLRDLMAASDIICVCAPLTGSTRHLIDPTALKAAKLGAYLVNVGRGALLDEQALITALLEERLAGAALDVLEQEPPPYDHPLLHMPNVIVTPHSLGATVENADLIAGSIFASIQSILRGERPRNTVNL